jgi:hypothetical protein
VAALAEATCWRCSVLTECRAYAAQTPAFAPLWGAQRHSGRRHGDRPQREPLPGPLTSSDPGDTVVTDSGDQT